MKWLKLNKKYVILVITNFLVFASILPAYGQSYVDFLDVKAQVIDGKTVNIRWVTNVETKGKIVYGLAKDDLPYCVGISGPATKYHEVAIGNFKPETTYYYQIIVNDFGGDPSFSFVNKFKTLKYNDGTAPEIKNVKIPYQAGTTVVLSWETDELSTTKVEYDSSRTYKSKAGSDEKVFKHSVILKKLKPNTQYYLRLYSSDKDKNKSAYVYREFTTYGDITDKEDLSINYIRPGGPNDSQISSQSVMVTFKVSRYAKGKVTLKSKGQKTQTKALDYEMEQSAVFVDLMPATDYDVEISMTDVLGKKSTEKFSFTTRKYGFTDDSKIYYGQPLPLEGIKSDDIKVLGAEFSYYTPASALYKISGSTKIYSILKGKRYLISSLSSFKEYNYNMKKVKVISKDKITKYSRVKLVKSPDSPAVYYLFERPGEKIYKIDIPSPSVFNSYPNNSWANIVKISDSDILAFNDVKLIKSATGVQIYYLEGNVKRPVSAASFINLKFNKSDVFEISQKHIDSYKTGSAM